MQQRVKLRIPFARIVESTLLNPISEIILAHLVGNIQQRMIRFDKSDRSILIGDAFIAKDQFVRRELRPIAARIRVPFIRFVIEDDQVASRLSIIEQLLIDRNQCRL